MTDARPKTAKVMRGYQLQEAPEDEVDYWYEGSFFGTHANTIPMQNAVQPPRLFYGARFIGQAVSQVEPEEALVQNLKDPERNVSYDDELGKHTGAVFADQDAVVEDVKDSILKLRLQDGTQKEVHLHKMLPFNRKSALWQRPVVKPGQAVKAGEPLVASNFTTDRGTLAMGKNARIGLLAYKGFSQDDAMVVSRSFANRMTSEAVETLAQDFDDNVRGGLDHFRSVLPERFKLEQLEKLTADGVAKPGTVLMPGDPIVLATKPRVLSSLSSQVGKLGSAVKLSRSDASQVWEGRAPAKVVDVAKTKTGWKVILQSQSPAAEGDKIVLRAGAKGTIAKILPDELMPRTADGQPLELLYNQLGLVSRGNASTAYELMLGKLAKKLGHPIKVPAFNKSNEKWYDQVETLLKENGVEPEEMVFDPESGEALGQPATVGYGYVLKLHHMAENKAGSRGLGGYDANQQPSRGGADGAKRLSGLETAAAISSGAYATLRSMSTVRGQESHDFWNRLKEGGQKPRGGVPFVWNKFRALLEGAGLRNKDLGDGRIRLGPLTDRDLDERRPLEIKNEGMVDMRTLEPVAGGLFDPSMVGAGKWGYIPLDEPLPNPAFEDSIRTLLGIRKKDVEALLAGEITLADLQK